MAADLTLAILKVWEDGHDASPGERGLLLLDVALAGQARAAREGLTVGQRDVALLGLFRHLFGDSAAALVDCPDCGALLETFIPIAAMAAQGQSVPAVSYLAQVHGTAVGYRLPTAADLAALGSGQHAEATLAVKHLLQRCILPAGPGDTMSARNDAGVSDDALAILGAALEASIAAHDPMAEITLACDCPSCRLHWLSPFDIVEFLWKRLGTYVAGLFGEVHVIAAAYGWSETDILALGTIRRRHYRELIGT